MASASDDRDLQTRHRGGWTPPRRYPRSPVSIECQLEGVSAGASLRLSELSVGGCYVDTRTDFRPGERVTITAAFPSAELEFRGTILYVHSGYGFGVAFDTLAPNTREQLEKFLLTLTSLRSDGSS